MIADSLILHSHVQSRITQLHDTTRKVTCKNSKLIQQKKEIFKENKRMLNRLLNILNQKQFFHQIPLPRNRPRTSSLYHSKKKQTDIDKQNSLLADRIIHAKPLIGTRSKWAQDFHKSQLMQNNIRQYCLRKPHSQSANKRQIDQYKYYFPDVKKDFNQTAFSTNDYSL